MSSAMEDATQNVARNAAQNATENTGGRTKVLLDIGPAVHQGAGLSRYAERLASHLQREQSRRLDLSFFYNAHSGHVPPASLSQAKTQTVNMSQYRWRISALTSQLMHRPMRSLNWPPVGTDAGSPASIYHATEHLLPRLGCPTVMTVHDLIFERYPEHHTMRNRAFLKLAMPTFVRAATAIIAVSEHTRRDLMELYGCPHEIIHVIHEGIDEDFRPASRAEVDRVRTAYNIQRPYLFMMGTLEPRKNHATALQALARLKAAGRSHQLVVAGGKGWLFEPVRAQVEDLGLENDVIFTGYVPQEDVAPLYTGADCVMMPSLYEGFGFPVLEAMACGTPVVCSDASSLPEIAGDAALLVGPTDDEALAANVQRILDDPELAASLVERGLDRAARFSWSECARRTADLYEELGST